MSSSRSRSRSPILARQLAHELQQLPQEDRLALTKLRALIVKAKDWQQVAHLCVINCNVSQHIMNVRTEIPEILKFQEAFSDCNQESQTMKQRAYVSFFDCMDEIDKTVSEMARHRDGSAFIVSGHQVFILLARHSILVLFYTLAGVFLFLLQAAARW